MVLSADEKILDITTRAHNILREIGFGVHETEVILALNQLESCTVSDISAATGIHHANLYTILSSLESKGLVVSNDRRPKVFEFTPLSHLEDVLSSKITQLIQDLECLQQERGPKGIAPTLIYTIRGRVEVQAKLYSMISKAEERILLVAPNPSELGESVIDALKGASERGVTIRAIFRDAPVDLDFAMQQRIKEDSLAVNLVTDGIEAVISMPDLSVCGWADNALISLQLEGFLEQTWNMARTI
ncbi:MAG: TrmB family transcriptional regulator [Candidatus Thorarchaeota archaeon]|jgi:sugar-specific transcriptional regulator TrmB